VSELLRFPVLDAIPFVNAAFLGRIPGIDVDCNREVVLERLASAHEQARAGLGFVGRLATCEQVHGNRVAFIDSTEASPVGGCDGLVTTTRGLCLGIYVADCAPVYLTDRLGRVVALVHSGRKGTEGNIAERAVAAVCKASDVDADDLVAVIGPCIRPPLYDVDFAAQICAQLAEAGVGEIHDDRICTAADSAGYYSYRREQGKTGRMLALIALV